MIDECLEARLGPLGIFTNERVNGRKGIDQEVRLDLRLQHREAKIGLVLLPAQRRELPGVLRFLPDSLLAKETSQSEPAAEAQKQNHLGSPEPRSECGTRTAERSQRNAVIRGIPRRNDRAIEHLGPVLPRAADEQPRDDRRDDRRAFALRREPLVANE